MICVSFVAPAFRKYCLPYVPATDSQIENILKIINGKSKNGAQRLLDIGSGDGRVVIGGYFVDKVDQHTDAAV